MLMILSFRDRKTSRFAQGEYVKEFSGFARQAEIRLDRLEAATSLKDLAALPGNRVELLTGDRKGQYSIRINTNGGFASSGRKVHPVRSTWK